MTGIFPRRLLDALAFFVRDLSFRTSILLGLIPTLSLLSSLAITLRDKIPSPRVQDEFSYVLAGDTFASGRLTNPTPAFWEHFETLHELMRPSYMSKYPPAQGLCLAMGIVLARLPIVGVWISGALACAAIYWMLLAFVTRPWALLGGAMAILHPLLVDWTRIYWGGSAVVLGGAMVLGAWGRLMQRPGTRAGFTLGTGLAILANSRPYEGLIFSMALMIGLGWEVLKQRSVARYVRRVGVPIFVVLLPAALAMGYYNFRVTGHPLRMPFEEYARQYDVYPKFWFLPKHAEPDYRNEQMRAVHTEFERGCYDEIRGADGWMLSGLVQITRERIWRLIVTHANPLILLVPLAVALPSIADKTLRWVWFAMAAMMIGLLIENFYLAHYAAPVTPAILLLIVVGWQRLSAWNMSGRSVGVAVSASLMVGFFCSAIVRAAAPPSADSRRVEQTVLVEQSKSLQAGRHLIFVRYTAGHLIHDEWVYNSADIKGSRIIWARAFGPDEDAPVANYYTGRQLWLLTVGEKDLSLIPYQLPHP